MKNGIFFLILFVLLISLIPKALASEIDATTTADWIIDGDTFDTTSQGRMRLADIDAPEYYESGYSEAKDFLSSLVDGKTVYLDIDDVYRTDRYGRLVCVVYVRYNSTHYLNVNEALLVEKCAVISDYYNEFNPYTWTLYVNQNDIPEITLPTILTTLSVAGVLVVLLSRVSAAIPSTAIFMTITTFFCTL